MVAAGRGMAVATVFSRVTGFVRTLALVAALGLGTRLLDAYNVANVLPNSIYDLVLGGALASVVVPLLVRADDLYAQRLLSLVVYALGLAVVVAVLFAPQIVHLFTPGFTGGQRELTVTFTRLFLPQVLFYGASATLTAVLNVRGRLAVPLWAPIANNLVVIATAGAYLAAGGTARPSSAQVWLLGLGTTAGVAAQLVVLALAGRRAGFTPRLRANPRGIGIRRVAGMAGWTVASVLAGRAVLLVVTRVASSAGTGAVSVYQNAYTLYQLPYAVIAVTIITGALPRMSRAAAERDMPQVVADLSQSLRLTGVVLMPVAAALIVLGPRVTTVLFAHGNAVGPAASLTGSVLAAYGVALVPFAGFQIMLRAFYALQDTRTPALINIGVTVLSIGGAMTAARLLPGPRLVVGLALGAAVASTAGLLVSALLLRRRFGRLDGHRLARAHTRFAAAALVAALAGAWTTHLLAAGALVTVLAAVTVGAALYTLTARLLHITELRTVASVLRP